jgi:MFS family permease
MIGFFILIISCLFIGPSRLLGFPRTSSAMMIIGLGILGCGAAFTVIPVIPEMLNAVEGKYLENKSEVSDNFSGIFNVAGGFGQIIGPTIAGLLKDEVGFNYTFDFLTLSVLAFNLIYIFL